VANVCPLREKQRYRDHTYPLSAGPMIAPVLEAIELRLKALGYSSPGTRLGTSACWAGRSNDEAVAWIAVSR